MATHDMRKKLQWLLVSRLAIAGALLLTVGLIEKEPSPRSFLPVLIGVATMSGLIGRGPGWPEYLTMQMAWTKFLFSLNLMAIFAVAVLSSQLAERLRRNESEIQTARTELASAARDLADYRLFNDRI